MRMLLSRHVVQVNAYMKLRDANENDPQVVVAQATLLRRKMYNQARKYSIFFFIRNLSFWFTLFFVSTAGISRLKTSGISSYVSLLIIRKREFCA